MGKKMDDKNKEHEMLRERYQKIYKKISKDRLKSAGGVFTESRRMNLLNLEELDIKDINSFWYKTRTYVKTALVDMQLFIEVAGKKNIDQVFTRESLEPIVRLLLWDTAYLNPNLNRAEIANLFIQWGFQYFRETARPLMTSLHQRILEDALNLSNDLKESFKPEKDRRYSSYGGVYSP